MTLRPRPLSPHLSAYRFTLTMTMSIVHRITGIANYVGTVLLVGWLAAAAIGGGALDVVHGFFGHWFGQLVLIGYTWSLFHHMLGGLRHFVWDSGAGMGWPMRWNLALINLVGSVFLTAVTWGTVFLVFRW